MTAIASKLGRSLLIAGCFLIGVSSWDLSAQDFSSRLGEAISGGDSTEYVGGRGAITREGPTGMFINPTSGTLPQGSLIFQYCFYNENTPAELNPFGHNFLLGYGVTDGIEIGAVGTLLALKNAGDQSSAGPYGRVRLLRDEGWIPEFSVGGYRYFGDGPLEKTGAFLAGYKRVPLDESGFFQALGFHAGVRQVWFDAGPDTLNGYGGLELELPYDLKLIGEISTRDGDRQFKTPWAGGVRWIATEWLALNIAAFQDGTQERTMFFFGVGLAGESGRKKRGGGLGRDD